VSLCLLLFLVFKIKFTLDEEPGVVHQGSPARSWCSSIGKLTFLKLWVYHLADVLPQEVLYGVGNKPNHASGCKSINAMQDHTFLPPDNMHSSKDVADAYM
jgi:hypothetical protein